ncbi:sugar kinase [Streptococcus gallolyticus]|nr:sugar kinase [Streptococcus gallolyticus]MBY5040137.1 sugar kinase [Streptococcus gallolyticus]
MSKILFFGEPLLRISPTNPSHFTDQVTSQIFYGGSEVNIARNLQAFGQNTKLAIALPTNSIGDSFIQFLQAAQIDTQHVQRVGERIGIYFLENAFGCRQGEVTYDRAHSSLHDFSTENLDYDSLFADVDHFHFSGITIALSQQVRTSLRQLLEEAKKRGITISLDLNFRSKLISPLDAKHIFSEFAHYADICFGIEPLMATSEDTSFFNRELATPALIHRRMQDLMAVFGFKSIFHTVRSTDNLGRNVYQAYMASSDGDFVTSKELKTAVLQRVGSGDAFVAGALYQLKKASTPQEIVDFAVASATLKCTIEGDNMFESAYRVEQVLNQAKDIIR